LLKLHLHHSALLQNLIMQKKGSGTEFKTGANGAEQFVNHATGNRIPLPSSFLALAEKFAERKEVLT
jgi:hypothetical protein